MKESRHEDRHGYYFSHAYLIGVSMVILTLIILTDDVICQEKVPRWIYELPTSEDVHYAIGECGRFRDVVKQSSEARRLAAFRLSASMCAAIRFGVAEEESDVNLHQVSFVAVSVDTIQMERFITTMTVLDSVELKKSFHILVSSSPSAPLPTSYKELITMDNSTPEWVRNPPVDSNYIYGLGSSWKNDLLGFEEAERLARADIAAQITLRVQTGGWRIITSMGTINQSATRQTLETKVSNSQVIRRAVDDNGVNYVLVRIDKP